MSTPESATEPTQQQIFDVMQGVVYRSEAFLSHAEKTLRIELSAYWNKRLDELLDDIRAFMDPDAMPPADARLLAMANAHLHERLSLQRRIGQWQDKTFGSAQTLEGLGHKLEDEIGELLTAETDDQVMAECADVLHLLFGIAHRKGFDLLSACEAKFAINQTRNWGTPDERGTISHVDEP